jgi:hypothetical protein
MSHKPVQDELPERSIYGTHAGDLGVIGVAILLTLVMVGILLLPSPFAKLEKAQADQARVARQQARVARQKEIDKAVASGEVSVSISPVRHH